MDEYLFITLAKLKSDRLKLQREQRANAELGAAPPRNSAPQIAKQSPQRELNFAPPLWREIVMKKSVLTLAASLAINLAGLAAFERGVNQAQLPPAGEVTVTQLVDSAEASLLAQAAAGGQLVATNNGSL